MANVNAPQGLVPVRSLGHSNVQVNEYAHPSTDGTAIFRGDGVTSTGDATSAIAGINDGTPYVIASGSITTGSIRGAAAGVRPSYTNLTLQYGPASVAYALLVNDDPFQLFNIQSDGTVATADVGDNISLLVGTGSTVTGISAYQAHEATQNTTVECLRIIRLAPIVGNALGANGILEVKIDNHELAITTGN